VKIKQLFPGEHGQKSAIFSSNLPSCQHHRVPLSRGIFVILHENVRLETRTKQLTVPRTFSC
jgi:hypothetical protein